MKKLFLACALIPCIAFADGGYNRNGLKLVVRDSRYTYEYDRTRDMSGLSQKLRGSQFHGSTTLPAAVVGSNGAQSADAIPAAYRVVTDKRKVFASLLSKARAAGPYIAKKGFGFLGGAVRFGLYSLAYDLVKHAIFGSKFSWNDDRNDFVRPADDNTYVVLATKTPGSSTIGQAVTSHELDNICNKMEGGCTLIDYPKGLDAAMTAAHNYCKGITFKGSDNVTHNFERMGAWGGRCYSEKYNTISSLGVAIYKYVDYVPMTLDEFIEEGTPEATAAPDEWVRTSEVKPDGEPKIMVTDGTVAQSRPYTDPADGKAKQSKWTFNSDGSVKEVITDRPDLTPDSPQAPKLDPNAVPDNKTDNPDKKTQPASQPAPIDLCKEHPDILACDTVPDKPETTDTDFDIPKEEVSLKFTPDNVFPTDGVCPVPVQFQAFGSTFGFSMQPACDLAGMLRPMIIAFAWLVAAFFCARTIRES